MTYDIRGVRLRDDEVNTGIQTTKMSRQRIGMECEKDDRNGEGLDQCSLRLIPASFTGFSLWALVQHSIINRIVGF